MSQATSNGDDEPTLREIHGEQRALRAEVATYRAETQAQRAESAAIIDRLGRAIEHLESDMSAVVRHLFGEEA